MDNQKKTNNNQQKVNYQLLLDQILADEQNHGKTLFLHTCCAPCSSYVLEYLAQYFRITVFYYNPNITLSEEYDKRVKEQKRLIATYNEQHKCKYPISFIEGDYEPQKYLDAVKGHESDPEGGDRCRICFALRLKEACSRAAEGHFDYVCTSLTISPMKNAQALNEIGMQCAADAGVNFLPSDFKKRNGYKRSIELSREYDLYRQNYCGCVFSQNEVKHE